jgi:aryl-alcohol dehydrogenase-like predicted oxidoreductase
LIGASRVSQIEDAVGIQDNINLSDDEIQKIENILAG